nr:MAG TPA: hypothetical protein [Caudoviricetes sp.]
MRWLLPSQYVTIRARTHGSSSPLLSSIHASVSALTASSARDSTRFLYSFIFLRPSTARFPARFSSACAASTANVYHNLP